MRHPYRASAGAALLLLSLGGGLYPAAVAANIDDTQVNALVRSWGNALKEGDTTRMESMAGGKLSRSRRGIWRNPDFAQELRDTYAGATITVTEVVRDNNSTALIGICIQFPGGLPMYRQLTVADINGKGDYRIIGDTPVTH